MNPDHDRTPTVLDLRHLRCPMPVLRTGKALRSLSTGDTLIVHCTDPLATLDIPHLLNGTGDALLHVERDGTLSVFTIRKAG